MSDQESVPASYEIDIKATYRLDATDVADNLTPTEIVDFVMDIEKHTGDWQVTCRLYHHFKEQYDLAQVQAPDDWCMDAEQLDEALESAGADDEAVTP